MLPKVSSGFVATAEGEHPVLTPSNAVDMRNMREHDLAEHAEVPADGQATVLPPGIVGWAHGEAGPTEGCCASLV